MARDSFAEFEALAYKNFDTSIENDDLQIYYANSKALVFKLLGIVIEAKTLSPS